MTRDEVIALAREAHGAMLASGRGMHVWHDDAYVGDVQDFCERFAALVAAVEREACAKVCDPEPSLPNEAYTVLNNKATMRRLAAAIRSRT